LMLIIIWANLYIFLCKIVTQIYRCYPNIHTSNFAAYTARPLAHVLCVFQGEEKSRKPSRQNANLPIFTFRDEFFVKSNSLPFASYMGPKNIFRFSANITNVTTNFATYISNENKVINICLFTFIYILVAYLIIILFKYFDYDSHVYYRSLCLNTNMIDYFLSKKCTSLKQVHFKLMQVSRICTNFGKCFFGSNKHFFTPTLAGFLNNKHGKQSELKNSVT